MGAYNIPFSNSAGNNQTSPGAGMPLGKPVPIAGPGGAPGGSTSPLNPYSPVAGTSSPVPVPGTSPSTAATYSSAAPASSTTPNYIGLESQLTDIYGAGVGGALTTLLSSMSGVDSAALQEYIQSLMPSFAQSKATLGAGLGAEGVGANSSVNALAQSNLQAQENAMIAGESANLQTQEEQLSAGILTGMEPAAAAQTAESPWDTVATILSGAGQDAGSIMEGIGMMNFSKGI